MMTIKTSTNIPYLFTRNPSQLQVFSRLYECHVEPHVCKMDLEGIRGRRSQAQLGPYTAERERTTWFKIKNPKYSQMEGREELFRRERHSEPAPGWHSCELACAELE